MLLPQGVTGFWSGNETEPPQNDLRAFRGHCYDVAQLSGGSVISMTEPYSNGLPSNYAVCVLSIQGDKIAVLLSVHHPFVAFAEELKDGDMVAKFKEVPVLANAFRSFGVYQVLCLDDLESPATSTSLQHLSEAEQEQIKYWKPSRIGDIIFNSWD